MFPDKESFIKAYLEKFAEVEGKPIEKGSIWDKYNVLVMLLKDKINLRWADTNEYYSNNREKQVYYFSMEFLIGRLLSYYLLNLGIEDMVRDGLKDIGIEYNNILAQEYDAGLGNGGLGRLAACFLDSMAFLGVPGHGNGIRYKYGLFEQKVLNGFQVEVPDNWLKNDYPWEIRNPDKSVIVKFKGDVKTDFVDGKLIFFHDNYEAVLAVPYDVPIIGFDNLKNINNLRLWSAELAVEEFDLASFNSGEYAKSAVYKSEVEAISYILYPEDSSQAGRELRLKQEYFFVAAGLATIVNRDKRNNGTVRGFSRRISVHINDTHPALCIPELMRILIDEEGVSWDDAWNITVNTISYTNHTIMPEALEKWPIDLFRYLLPRIYQIVEEIDRRYKDVLTNCFPNDCNLYNNTTIIRDGYVWMSNLAVIGSHSVNGVSELHTELLKNHVMNDFQKIYPYKFKNVTNGVSHRRFLLKANPRLSELITSAIGDKWITKADELERLVSFERDNNFLNDLSEVKAFNKQRLAAYISERQGIQIDPSSVFDIQVKRIHAYKRQLLNIFKIMYLYNRLKEDSDYSINPHTFIFGGKAAPGYHYAKSVIKLISTVAQKINNDPDINGVIKIVFLENFSVSLAQLVYPAADISEQISTASKEASGTGNMKFMLNGALTLGTLDGANVEIRESVGDEHIAIFGLTAAEVMEYYRNGGYESWDEYYNQPRLKEVIDQLINCFYDGIGGDFRMLYDSLLQENDQFFILKDFASYIGAWNRLNALYTDKYKWFDSSLVNIAKAGRFSSDFAIKNYAKGIWRTKYNERAK